MFRDPYALLFVVDAPDLLALKPHGQAVAVQVRVIEFPGQAEGRVGGEQAVPLVVDFVRNLGVEGGVRVCGIADIQRRAHCGNFQSAVRRCGRERLVYGWELFRRHVRLQQFFHHAFFCVAMHPLIVSYGQNVRVQNAHSKIVLQRSYAAIFRPGCRHTVEGPLLPLLRRQWLVDVIEVGFKSIGLLRSLPVVIDAYCDPVLPIPLDQFEVLRVVPFGPHFPLVLRHGHIPIPLKP